MSGLIEKDAAVEAMLQLERDDEEDYGARIPEGFDGARAVEAIPVAWIEEYIKGFKNFAYGNGMSDMVAFQMRDIVEKWRERQK